jgi:hypothetical protein
MANLWDDVSVYGKVYLESLNFELAKGFYHLVKNDVADPQLSRNVGILAWSLYTQLGGPGPLLVRVENLNSYTVYVKLNNEGEMLNSKLESFLRQQNIDYILEDDKRKVGWSSLRGEVVELKKEDFGIWEL